METYKQTLPGLHLCARLAVLERVERDRKHRRSFSDGASRTRTGDLLGDNAAGVRSTRRSGARSALVLELSELNTTDLAGQCLREIVDEFDLARVGVG